MYGLVLRLRCEYCVFLYIESEIVAHLAPIERRARPGVVRLMHRTSSYLLDMTGAKLSVSFDRVLTDPADVRAFYTNSQTHYKSPASNGGWVFHQLLGQCLGMMSGQRWKTLRSRFESCGFERMKAKDRLLDTLNEASDFVKALIGARDQKEAELNASQAVAAFPFFYTARRLFGELSKADEEELWGLGQQRAPLMRFVLMGGVYRYGFSRWWDRAMWREVQVFKVQWRAFCERAFAKNQGVNATPSIESLWRDARSGQVSMDEVLQTFDEMLFANLDVTTHVLSWYVVLLAKEKRIQEHVREDIAANRSDIQSYVASKDTLLHCSLLETLRLRPVSGTRLLLASHQIPADMM